MKALLFLPVICLCCLNIKVLASASEDWDLVVAYNASTHVFYGEVSKIVPEPDYETGVMGVRVRDIDESEFPLEALTWPKAKELTFTVVEPFKQALEASFQAYLPDPDTRIWTHVMNASGDVFLAKPESPEALLLTLKPGDRGLFFIRYYLGSNIPVIYKVRFGQGAESDLALLRAHRAAGSVPLDTIMRKAQAEEAAEAVREAAAFRVFEDDYYKVLRIQDLEIRRSLLTDLVERMGFEGLWTFFEFKDRYLKAHGSHLDDSAIPSAPEGREKLWHDISGELKKIEVILKARDGGR